MTKTRDLANLIADSKVGPSEIDTTGTYQVNSLGVGMAADPSVKLTVNGAIGPTNGSASAPTHTFYSDPDTGMFRTAANTLGFSSGGTEYVQLGSFGVAADQFTNKTAGGDVTIGAAGGILLDTDNNQSVKLKLSGTHYASLYKSNDHFMVYNPISNGDIRLQGKDGSSVITALTLDMSEAGKANFNGDVDLENGALKVGGTTVIDSSRVLTATGGTMTGALTINLTSNNPQFRMQGNALWDFYSYNDDNFYINNSSGTVLGLLANKDAYFGKNLSVGDSVLSTYHADYPAIDIGSSASVQGYTGNNGVWLQSNLFMNTNGHWTSKSDDYSAMIELYDGNINFYNTASGTGTRTLLTPMTIRQSGNVGIGNASQSDYYAGASNLVIGSNNGTDNGLTIVTPQNKIGRIHFADGTSGASAYAGFIAYNNSSNQMVFGSGADGGTDFQIENGKCTVEGDLDVGGQLVSEAKRILDHPTQSHALAHYQELVCHNSITTSNKNTWMDVAFTGHSCIFKVYGATIENNDNALGGARLITNMLVTYGNHAFTTDAYKVTAMNGGGISSLEYRYLNSGGNAGSHRLQVRANWSTSTTMVVYTTITGMSETLSVAEDN